MAEAKVKPWTDAEKLGILFQIIEKGGPIPWNELTFPEGRTKKAVQVMIDKEKTKLKKARAEEMGTTDGEDKSEAKTPVKRKANGDADGSGKKAKTPRKTEVKAREDPKTPEEDEETPTIKDESAEGDE